MITRHFEENCNAPICQEFPNDDTVWYAGEEVCCKKPFNRIQKMQNSLNYLLRRSKLEKPDRPYTERELSVGGI